jgi:hypothetical protein
MSINMECNRIKYTTPSSPPRVRRGNRPDLWYFSICSIGTERRWTTLKNIRCVTSDGKEIEIFQL